MKRKRSLLMTAIGAAFAAVMMIAMAQTALADDSDITMEYIPSGSIAPTTLDELNDDWFKWKPEQTEGDIIIITENGVETKYICDRGNYKGYERVLGYYDDDGNALGDRFRCLENGYSEIYGFYPDFEWVEGEPKVSGQTYKFRFLLYELGASEDAEPVAKSNPIDVYISPVCVEDELRYKVDKDGTAYVDRYMGMSKSGYTIRDTVTMDDGKEYPVKHIGLSNIYAALLADGGTFMFCEELESITIPPSITTIKSYAFIQVPKMKEVTIPPTVERIGHCAFGYTADYSFFGNGLSNIEKIPGFVIYAKTGSEGARYAKENGFKLVDLEAQERDEAADRAYEKAKQEAKKKYTPAKVKITKVTKGKKKMTVKWKKIPKATGYKVRYSMDKNFKKGVKTKTVEKYSKKGLTIKKLKKNKKWYVQVRAYRKAGGETYYGAWSAKKYVKVK